MDEMRKKLIALAHMAAARAGCHDEDVRRDVQMMVTGVASCRDMDVAALTRLIRYWQAKGARVRLPVRASKQAASDRAPLIAKLAAMCHAGGYPFPAYPLGVLRHMGCAVERIEWAPSPMLRKAVAAMRYQEKRHACGQS
jgi:hypothetical protein